MNTRTPAMFPHTFAALLILGFSLLFFPGCGGDGGSPDTEGREESEAINSAAGLQEDTYALLTGLLAEMDTLAAEDSVVRFLRADSLVVAADTSSQGISVMYACGMMGGIILDYKDGPLASDPPPPLGTTSDLAAPQSGYVVPADKRTVIINPHYYEREEYTQPILETYDACLPMAGFWKPEAYFNQVCTVDKMTALEHYGFIHLYAHGCMWALNPYADAVYLMTGESVNQRTTTRYWREITAGSISLLIGKHGHNYFVSPQFIAAHNDFTPDSTLIFGGFCYSILGSWPQQMCEAGAAGYFGFDWAVRSDWHAYWARTLCIGLTDTLRFQPMTAADWILRTPDIPKHYADERAPSGKVRISFYGQPNLALLRSRVKVDLSQVNEVWCDVYVNIDWSCGAGYNLALHQIRQPVELSSQWYEVEWERDLVYTGGVPVEEQGLLDLAFSRDCTEIDSFFVTCTRTFIAGDDTLNLYGYPRTKIQSYGGRHLPIWVNEPGFNRYIYGVQGKDAADYLTGLTCTYAFPSGAVCEIDSYEFTDDVLQMVRFDFHRK